MRKLYFSCSVACISQHTDSLYKPISMRQEELRPIIAWDGTRWKKPINGNTSP